MDYTRQDYPDVELPVNDERDPKLYVDLFYIVYSGYYGTLHLGGHQLCRPTLLSMIA